MFCPRVLLKCLWKADKTSVFVVLFLEKAYSIQRLRLWLLTTCLTPLMWVPTEISITSVKVSRHLKLWVRSPFKTRCTRYNTVIKFVSDLWFSPVSFTNKTDRHDITEILLKVALNTIRQTNQTPIHGWGPLFSFD